MKNILVLNPAYFSLFLDSKIAYIISLILEFEVPNNYASKNFIELNFCKNYSRVTYTKNAATKHDATLRIPQYLLY